MVAMVATTGLQWQGCLFRTVPTRCTLLDITVLMGCLKVVQVVASAVYYWHDMIYVYLSAQVKGVVHSRDDSST